MSSFCGGTGNVPAMTASELREIFPNGILPNGLPPMESGLAAEDWIRNYVLQLEQQGRIPSTIKATEVQSNMFDSPETKDPLAEFVSREKGLQEAIKSEYCFYEKRYFSALDGFLTSVGDASLKDQASSTVQARLDITRQLNQKLTLLSQITNGFSKYRYAETTKYQNDINGLNESLKARQKKLLEQNRILQKETAAADLHKQMVSYTVEKNKANTNLLTLYGILNITALAMIFYIARS
jgi:hypothetical protein